MPFFTANQPLFQCTFFFHRIRLLFIQKSLHSIHNSSSRRVVAYFLIINSSGNYTRMHHPPMVVRNFTAVIPKNYLLLFSNGSLCLSSHKRTQAGKEKSIINFSFSSFTDHAPDGIVGALPKRKIHTLPTLEGH